MQFTRIGKTFKNKTGKSTTFVLSREDLAKLESLLQPTEKYGDQVRLLITGTPNSQYGHSVSIVEGENENDITGDDDQRHVEVDIDELPI